ncbi:DedA family protein [Brevibacillus sp. HD1.4A]|uniref:DedA family protein n=1 Tax=Brevibacillus sp. HD1.4A TaxID=2738978 RepID=UPI00352FBD3C
MEQASFAIMFHSLWKQFFWQLSPDEMSVIGFGARMAHADTGFLVVYAAVFAAVSAGVGAGYLVSAWLGAPVLAKWAGKRWHKHVRLMDWEQEYMGWVLAISMFIPVIRHIVPIVAGLYRMPLRQFVAFFLPSTFVWTLHYFLMGYWFAAELDVMLAGVYSYSKITLTTVALAAAVYMVIRQYIRLRCFMLPADSQESGDCPQQLKKEPTA